MRVVLLILLIALAPLRGMANEWMATRMATTLAMSVSAPATAGDMPASGHHCEEMAASAEPAATRPMAAHHADTHPEATTTAASHDGCENCSLCQMCASAALPAELRVALPVLVPQLQAPAHTDRFASAPAALAQKPPIS